MSRPLPESVIWSLWALLGAFLVSFLRSVCTHPWGSTGSQLLSELRAFGVTATQSQAGHSSHWLLLACSETFDSDG